jgi:hypothetical protein
MYTIKQTETKKCLFGLISREVEKVYKFATYNEAVNFAFNEQINKITCNISDKVKTTRRPFKTILTLEQFIKVSKKNPFHFLGVRNYKKINIKLYYFYLVNSNQLQKLKKFE